MSNILVLLFRVVAVFANEVIMKSVLQCIVAAQLRSLELEVFLFVGSYVMTNSLLKIFTILRK